MLKHRMSFLHLIMFVLILAASAQADSIPIANHSFEVIEVLNPFGAVSLVSQWTELDVDANSQGTGVFRNTAVGSVDHITNPDGTQLAFMANFEGNSLSQFVASRYQTGKSYQLTVSACVSASGPPVSPSVLTLEFLYWPDDKFVPEVITSIPISPTGLTSTFLEDFTLSLPVVEATDLWSGRNIGIAIRANGNEGGYWDLDNVRVVEYPRTPNFNDDSIVNLADFAKMAADWQLCNGSSADITGDGCVNEQDLVILMEYWLSDA